jgi:radical SAM protein with 4Fe4S-binding SPASM domain
LYGALKNREPIIVNGYPKRKRIMTFSDPDEYIAAITRIGLNPPVELYVMVTTGCNLRCRHCWPQAVAEPLAVSIKPQTFNTLIDNFISLGIRRLRITGGEPLTHPDWAEMLAYAAARNELDQICLQTNGTKLSADNIEHIKKLPKEKMYYQVSLEGAQPEIHDALRGKGSFFRAMAGLRRLCEIGLGQYVTVAFTETQTSIEALPDLLELVDSLGLGQLVSGCLVTKGRARENPDLMLPKPDQYSALLDLYHRDTNFRERYDRLGNFAAIEWLKGKDYPLDNSCKCMATPIVTASGELYPCHMLPLECWRISGVFTRPFGDVIDQALTCWRHIPDIYRQRGNGQMVCQTCPGSAHCGGGCLGRVADVGDGCTGIEDRCELRQAVYSWQVPVLPTGGP